MRAIKTARKFIEANPANPAAKTLARLVLALASEEPFKLADLYALNGEHFELAMDMLKEWRLDAEQTQAELAATLGVRQDTISRLEQRSDMLLSTLRRYVEAMGGTLDLVVKFPDRPSVVLDHLPHG